MTALSILMPVVSGCSRIDLNRFISMMICYGYIVFSYWALAHGCGFNPQIKVKARLTISELGDRGGLYMWAGCMRILKCCDVVYDMYLSLDDT